MHAGNILCALLAYIAAKSKSGKFIIRIEDLDPLRCPRTVAKNMIDLLAEFGLTSDEEIIYQSDRTDAYKAAENKLKERARVYPCFCSRAELLAATAPRLHDGGVVYSGKCRDLSEREINELYKKKKPCYRIETPDETVSFTDGITGEYSQNLARECGDFILRRSDGVYAYQLAVAVDDCFSSVTEAVRGADLISSTPRQIWLMRLLNLRPPEYYHIPLVCDSSGRKLSKSEGDSAVRLLDRLSVQEILGALGFAAGILEENRPSTLAELTELFDWRKIKRDKIYLPHCLNSLDL